MGGGSPAYGKAPNKERGFDEAYDRLVRDYFSGPESTYDETDFERRFRMPRSVFTLLHGAVVGVEPSIKQPS